MNKPRLLDLFCGAGGSAMGYHRAGFEVVGVDIARQSHYPFEFHQADALEFASDPGLIARCFDVIHASPPCQAYTRTGWAIYFDYIANYPDLLTPTRKLLEQTGLPWVIENVPGAPMRPDYVLCGEQFGLGVRRHRWFERNPEPPWHMDSPCYHSVPVVSPHGNPNRFKGSAKSWGEAMGIDWMTGAELSQAIPPAYTQWIGERLMQTLEIAV